MQGLFSWGLDPILLHHLAGLHRRAAFGFALIGGFHEGDDLYGFLLLYRSNAGLEKFHNFHCQRHISVKGTCRGLALIALSQAVKLFILTKDSFAIPFPRANDFDLAVRSRSTLDRFTPSTQDSE